MGIFKSGDQRPRREGGKTIVAEGCAINGEISNLQGSLHVDGHIEGIVETSFDVSIGHNGSVSGMVKARSIYLSGELDGKIACERIEILSTGRLMGELISGELTIETGGKFIGQSRELSESGIVVGSSDTVANLEDNSGNGEVAELAQNTEKLKEKVKAS